MVIDFYDIMCKKARRRSDSFRKYCGFYFTFSITLIDLMDDIMNKQRMEEMRITCTLVANSV